jgi:hypothetical protein
LGVKVSKVRSFELDQWSEEALAFLERSGNAAANRYWLARLPANVTPPHAASDKSERTAFISDKYRSVLRSSFLCSRI